MRGSLGPPVNIRGAQSDAFPCHHRPPGPRDPRRRRPRGQLRRRGRWRRGDRGRPGAGAGHRRAGAGVAGGVRGGADDAPQPSQWGVGALLGRPARGRVAGRPGGRFRDHRQHRHPALRGRGDPQGAEAGADRRPRGGRPPGGAGAGAPRARQLRRPSQPARHGGVHRRWVQRRRDPPAGSGDRGREELRLSRPGHRLGDEEQGTDHRQHGHHHPAGTAGGQGPPDAGRRAPRRRPGADLRPPQGVAQLPLPQPPQVGRRSAGLPPRAG